MLKLTRSEMVDVLSAVLDRQDQIRKLTGSAKGAAKQRLQVSLINLEFAKTELNKALGEE